MVSMTVYSANLMLVRLLGVEGFREPISNTNSDLESQ